ncbi:CHAT domain-containing protein [Multifurca ochricompacta]|uniref:CHAT domain-containing protein n=1 Tax=Multifurca ochricompacta TaxID=376703 RepID=A0AAD4QKJ2_9AGAM|nr:CHAT domain-containing protein [Multifurca ochricompacta]
MFLTSPLSNDYFTFITAEKLADLLLRRFHRTHKLEFLNESISLSRDLLNMPVAKPFLLLIFQQLISSLFTRLPFLRRKQDFEEIMQLFSLASKDEHANIPIRFRFSCEWAQVSRRARHRSVLFAYQSSMSLMQASLVFAPNLDTQHFRLVSMRESYESLPLDYASYQIEKGQVEKAIEILEQGRALIWSEMRGLRTSIERLHRMNPSLAERFACVNKELEGLTTSISPLGLGGAPGEGGEGMDWFGHLVVKQRKLMEERDELVSEIQALPSFHNFLNLPQFENLRLAASRGPVIVINHSRCRSDIIIITAAAAATALHQPSPSLITTPDDFYDRANRLRDHLVDARKAGLDSKEYDDALTFVLTELYDLVGRPVLERLCALGIEEQSHVWWCPTSVFCSLPLHAIGPIPSEQGGAKRYFSDLYIPSYTPTLSALIESRNKLGSFNKQKPKLPKPSILLMAQPDDESLPGAWDEMKVVQAVRTKVTSLISEDATRRTVLEGLRDHQFAHFVCHGSLKSGKPFDASFKLHGRERLTLRDIVRSQIPNAEFAFLSACHTAELTDKSITDEALHLTAAMQYCGFGSVVGTMWAMADMDGRDLAKHFYKSMFSNSGTREREVGYYERSGEALRDAVKKLRRKKRMTLERWVNFVHYGG